MADHIEFDKGFHGSQIFVTFEKDFFGAMSMMGKDDCPTICFFNDNVTMGIHEVTVQRLENTAYSALNNTVFDPLLYDLAPLLTSSKKDDIVWPTL